MGVFGLDILGVMFGFGSFGCYLCLALSGGILGWDLLSRLWDGILGVEFGSFGLDLWLDLWGGIFGWHILGVIFGM